MVKTALRRFDYTQILSNLSTMGYMPRLGVLLLDLTLCAISYLLAYALGSNVFNYNPDAVILHLSLQVLMLAGVQTLFFWILHTYAGILRYSTFVDTIKVLVAVLLTSITLLALNYIIKQTSGQILFLNTAIIIYTFVAFVALFCLRVGIKTLFEEVQQHSGKNQRVVIYGTKQAGVAIAKMLRSSNYTSYRLVGFIEDRDEKKSSDKRRSFSRHQLFGLKVYFIGDDLIDTLDLIQCQNIIISPLKLKESTTREKIRFFIEHGIRVLTTPSFTDFEGLNKGDNFSRIGKISAISVEDLLERPKIEIDTENVRQTFENKVVMVTGAAGSIGSELVRQVIGFGASTIVLFEQAESALHDLRLDLRHDYPTQRIIPVIGDVRNRDRVEEIMDEMRPDVIFHAAAYKHVPLMEDYPNEAIIANVEGTKNMADMAVKYDVKRFIMISTDKAVNPTNIMGASKRIAEIYVQSLFKKLQKEDVECTRFITTRFGNVLGSNGSVIPYFKKQIAEGGPVTVTHPDIIRYFMTIPEACTLVLEASTLGQGGEIFVFDMGQPVRILDLAKNMIRLAGYVPGEDIQIVFSGLRPGEKLYEELLNQKETTLPTDNKKIMVAKVREFEFEKVNKQVDKLITTAHQTQVFATVKLMKEIVPEFISKNSVFEQLDLRKK